MAAWTYARWAWEDDPLEDFPVSEDEDMPDNGTTGSTAVPPVLTAEERMATIMRDLRARMRANPLVPSETTLALAGGSPESEGGTLGMRLRAWAERAVVDLTETDIRIAVHLLLVDHVCLIQGFDAVCRKLWRLDDRLTCLPTFEEQLTRQGTKEYIMDNAIGRLEAQADRADGKTRDLELRLTQALAHIEKGAPGLPPAITPNPEATTFPSGNITGLLGRVPGFSSEKESRCSFQAWAELFEEHAKLRGVPEAQWAALAKTNLAGNARERWVQVESTLPVGQAREWGVFKSTLTPLFADADKQDKAMAAYGRLLRDGCMVHSGLGLRDYGRTFLGLWEDMGEARVVTQEGAIQDFLKGLPLHVRSLLLTIKTLDPASFADLRVVVQRAMDSGAEYYKNVNEGKPPTARQQPPKRQDLPESSTPAALRASPGVQKKKQQQKAQHKTPKNNSNGPARVQDTRPVAELLSDFTIRGYVDREDNRVHYSPELSRALRESGKCLGCRQLGHRIVDCPSPSVPAHVKKGKAVQKN